LTGGDTLLTAHYQSTSLSLPKLFDTVTKGKDLTCHSCPWFMLAIAAWKMCACANWSYILK